MKPGWILFSLVTAVGQRVSPTLQRCPALPQGPGMSRASRLSGTHNCSGFPQHLSTFGLIYGSQESSMISPDSVKKNWIYHLENYCQSIVQRRRFCLQQRKTFVLQWWLPNFSSSAIKEKKVCFNLLRNSLQFVAWASLEGVVCQKREQWRGTA